VLREKLQEEMREYLTDNNIEELADILEVIYALAEHMKCAPKELEQIRALKAQQRGGFSKGIILERVS
jgi:predicted house-cleaning noncanonical NTP pyrophosphatase (MazG superfamily)